MGHELSVVILLVGAMMTTAVPSSVADASEPALNGTYTVVSNGEWAMMNDRYQDQPTVRSVWTISTTCTAPFRCRGEVRSDAGWTEQISTTEGWNWYVRRTIPNWIPCPDGTRGSGTQVYRIYPVNESGFPDPSSPILVGDDRTTGASGSCGRNGSLVLSMPVKLTKTA